MVNLYELPVLNTIPPKMEMAKELADIYAARESHWREKALALTKEPLHLATKGGCAAVRFYDSVLSLYCDTADAHGELARGYRLLQKFPLPLFLIERSHLERLLEEARRQPSLEAALAKPV